MLFSGADNKKLPKKEEMKKKNPLCLTCGFIKLDRSNLAEGGGLTSGLGLLLLALIGVAAMTTFFFAGTTNGDFFTGTGAGAGGGGSSLTTGGAANGATVGG